MKIRTLILAALVAVLCMASGAMAGGQWEVERLRAINGCLIEQITFTPGNIDTANHIGVDIAATVNDSLIFNSPIWTVAQPWTVAWGRVFSVTADTLSTIDSLAYDLQWKFESDYDSTWGTVAKVVVFDEDLMNTNPGTADMKAYFDADSVWAGDQFRLRVSLVAGGTTGTGDDWRAKDVSGILQFNAVYRWYFMFVHKGNQ